MSNQTLLFTRSPKPPGQPASWKKYKLQFTDRQGRVSWGAESASFAGTTSIKATPNQQEAIRFSFIGNGQLQFRAYGGSKYLNIRRSPAHQPGPTSRLFDLFLTRETGISGVAMARRTSELFWTSSGGDTAGWHLCEAKGFNMKFLFFSLSSLDSFWGAVCEQVKVRAVQA
ncbi:hypothetical protein ACJ72_03073 [Emergomyces africanus]|uniref:Uncharacterized protein n=1 Tax=Emergomyces africanus TaxID=1955775 RepID=A0A1B7P0N6_9EURO|nr:hypothetical protein ACJ72_03073 [Emergomyces africanus]